MLVCQLWCSTNYQVVGNNVVKCDLDTGLWTSSMPTCEAERLVVDTSANVGGKPAAPVKESDAKPPKKKKKKLAKACKKGNTNACAKLDKLKKEKMAEANENRTNDFDFVLPDFTQECGPNSGNSKCEKREMRKFCALHPTNFFC